MHGSNASSSSTNSSGNNYPFNIYRPAPDVRSLIDQKSRPPHVGAVGTMPNLHPAVLQQQKQQQQHHHQQHPQSQHQRQTQQQQQQMFDNRSRNTRSFNAVAADAVSGGTEPGMNHFGNSAHIFMADPHLSTAFSNYAKSVGMPPHNTNSLRTTFPNHGNSLVTSSVATIQQQQQHQQHPPAPPQQQQQASHTAAAVVAPSALDTLLHNYLIRRPPATPAVTSTTPSVANANGTSNTNTANNNNGYSTASAAAAAAAAAVVAAVTAGGGGRFMATQSSSSSSASCSVPSPATLVAGATPPPSTPSPAMLFSGLLAGVKEVNASRNSPPVSAGRSGLVATETGQQRGGGAPVTCNNSLVELLFHGSNVAQVSSAVASSISSAATSMKVNGDDLEESGEVPSRLAEQMKNFKLVQWLVTPQHKITYLNFFQWACACTRSFRRDRLTVWPRAQSEIDSLHSMNWLVSPPGLLGVYSESPFLRPARLLRRVQFATPGTVCTSLPDPDNMVRSLRDMADNQVARRTGLLSQTSVVVPPGTAASFGFTTDFMTYVFTVELDRHVIRLLSEQVKQQTSNIRHGRVSHPEWRVVLRFGWASSDFYIPTSSVDPSNTNNSSNNNTTSTSNNSSGPSDRIRRALVLESLPRMLMVRVAGRAVPLPEPIFHSGQAQKLGKRLRLSIDLTDRLPIRANAPLRSRVIDIEVSWLHAPVEDHPTKLLDMVAGEQMSPLLSHLIGLPLVQVTLDRAYSIAELRQVFTNHGAPLLDLQQPVSPPSWVRNQTEADELAAIAGVTGAYDNCIPPWQHITATVTKCALRKKLEASVDTELSISGVSTTTANCADVQAEDYIPLCLLCPITRRRIETPVRSIQCEHLQCFDLSSYLTISYRRPRWSCPICSCQATFRDLRLDDFLAGILADPRSQNATFIHVDAQGDWRLSPEDAGESSTEVTGSCGTATCQVQSPANQTTPSQTSAPLQVPKSEAGAPPSSREQPGPSAEVEVIVLSDDDDDDADDEDGSVGVGAAMEKRPPGSHKAGTESLGQIFGAKCSNLQLIPPPPSPSCLDHIKSPNSNQMQIDLTKDDSDDDESSLSSSSGNLDSSGPPQRKQPTVDNACRAGALPPVLTTAGGETLTSQSATANQSDPFVLLTPVVHRSVEENGSCDGVESGILAAPRHPPSGLAVGEPEGRRKLAPPVFPVNGDLHNVGGGAFFRTVVGPDEGPPGVDVFDYGGGDQLLSNSRASGSLVKSCAMSVRSRPPSNLKESQSNALTRLVHQRMARGISALPSPSGEPRLSKAPPPPLIVRLPSSCSSLAAAVEPRGRMKRTQQRKRFRRVSPVSDQSDEEEEDGDSNQEDGLSNTSVFTSENSTNEEDDEEEEEENLSGDSSDRSWVPPGENRRRRISSGVVEPCQAQRRQPKRARGTSAGGQVEKRISKVLIPR